MVKKYVKKTDREYEAKKARELPAKFKAGFLAELDGRTELSRTLRANYNQIVTDLGGESEIGHIKNALIERFVWLEAFLQTLEQQMAAGDMSPEEALNRWTHAVNTLASLASKLGMNNKAKAGRWTEALLVSGGGNGER